MRARIAGGHRHVPQRSVDIGELEDLPDVAFLEVDLQHCGSASAPGQHEDPPAVGSGRDVPDLGVPSPEAGSVSSIRLSSASVLVAAVYRKYDELFGVMVT
jgi:hypothetical protein